MLDMRIGFGVGATVTLMVSASLVGCAESGGGVAAREPVSVSAADLAGTWTSEEQGNPTLAFDESGAVEGTDGCNGIGTNYTIEGDTVSLDPFVSTLMACPGVNDWLRGVSEVQVDGDTMNVRNDAGEQIGTLQRAGDSQ